MECQHSLCPAVTLSTFVDRKIGPIQRLDEQCIGVMEGVATESIHSQLQHLCLFRGVKSKLCCCTCLQSRRAACTMASPSVIVCSASFEHQEVSPTFTVTEGEPDTCGMTEPSLRDAALSWSLSCAGKCW